MIEISNINDVNSEKSTESYSKRKVQKSGMVSDNGSQQLEQSKSKK